ncbi:hypothetical protein B1P88_00755 [Enterococcus faecium]|nr:hypothetical protein B1P88_00755 [Enterococcus faecium]
MEKTYQAGTNEGIVDFINMEDLEIAASQVIPAGGYGYISSGAGDLFTYQENERAFNHRLIIPHVLRDVELPDTTTHFDEEMLTAPIIMAPVAAHGQRHVEGGRKASAKWCSRFWDDLVQQSSYASVTFRRDKRSQENAK